MIREITDLCQVSHSQLKKLGDAFTAESGAGEFDLNHFIAKISLPLRLNLAKIWVIERNDELVGLLGGMVGELFFVKKNIAIEMFWYVDAENRGSLEAIRLIEHFETWAEKLDVKWIHMAFMENIHPEKMREFLIRRDYAPFESIYRKRL